MWSSLIPVLTSGIAFAWYLIPAFCCCFFLWDGVFFSFFIYGFIFGVPPSLLGLVARRCVYKFPFFCQVERVRLHCGGPAPPHSFPCLSGSTAKEKPSHFYDHRGILSSDKSWQMLTLLFQFTSKKAAKEERKSRRRKENKMEQKGRWWHGYLSAGSAKWKESDTQKHTAKT